MCMNTYTIYTSPNMNQNNQKRTQNKQLFKLSTKNQIYRTRFTLSNYSNKDTKSFIVLFLTRPDTEPKKGNMMLAFMHQPNISELHVPFQWAMESQLYCHGISPLFPCMQCLYQENMACRP